MTVSDLQELYNYDCWATEKLFKVISQLTAEEFTQSVAGSYGSIRNTMVHVISAEWGWLDRCGGAARGPKLAPADYPTAASLIELSHRVEQHLGEFFSTLKDDDLKRIVEYSNPHGDKRAGLLAELMQHAANHGVHHRGQVALLLRMQGYDPGFLDMLVYYAEKRSVQAF